MSAETSVRHSLPFLSTGQAQKELTHNEAVALIDAGLHPAAEELGTNTPPVAPVAGQCWIAGSAPTGAWAGRAGALACWTLSGWRFLAATEGMQVWLRDRQHWAVCEAGGWVAGDVRASRLTIEGLKVVGPRGAAVPVPSGGSTVDTEARSAIAALIQRLSDHGLITP